jgi:hypothetical protein
VTQGTYSKIRAERDLAKAEAADCARKLARENAELRGRA